MRHRRHWPSIHTDASIGPILFPLSLALCALLYWPLDPLYFQGASLILGLADGLAAIVGQARGRLAYNLTGHKTLEGSLTFFIVASLILLGLGPADRPGLILGAACLLTLTEAGLGRGWDNLPIPLLAGFMLYWI